MSKKVRMTRRQLRSLLLSEMHSPKPKSTSRLVNLLFEQEAPASIEDAKEQEVENKTILVLYGPPAAGKGAAKKMATDLAGKETKEGEKNFKDFLKSMKKTDPEKYSQFYQEEDKAMTDATTSSLPPKVFAMVHKAAGGEWDEASGDVTGDQGAFEAEAAEHFHVNENGTQSNLSDLLSWNTYVNLMRDAKGDPAQAADAFTNHPETQSWFAQARGWSKEVDGFELNDFTGVSDNPNMTLGFRWYASEKFLEDVEKDLEGFLSGEATETAANVYLADQSGESSANLSRIEAMGKLKEKYPNVSVVGAYIYQPADRTKIANLHRKAFDQGGRRVAQAEVDRIYDNAPEVDVDGNKVNVTDPGPAVEKMQSSGFDSIYVFAPPDAFNPDEETASDGRHVGAAICQPFGDGTGYFSIEGCDEFVEGGSQADAQQYAGMEKKAVKKAKLGDNEGFEDGFIPEKINSKEKQKLINALNDMGFGISGQNLLSYLKDYAPPGSARSGGSEFGANTYSKKLFAKETNPTAKSDDLATAKKESIRTENSEDGLIMERWRKLAGLLTD